MTGVLAVPTGATRLAQRANQRRQHASGPGEASPRLAPPALPAVVTAFEKSDGRILQRCANRLLGTMAGVAYSCLVLGVCLAVTGGGYADTAAK